MSFCYDLVDKKAVIAVEHFPFTFVDGSVHKNTGVFHKYAVIAMQTGSTFMDWIDSISKQITIELDRTLLYDSFHFNMRRAYCASEWADCQEVRDVFPFLRYVAINDDLVDPMHKKLNGSVKHIDDPFWQVFFPPNSFSCRCDVTSLTAEEAYHLTQAGNNHNIESTTFIPSALRRNFGQDKRLWKKWVKQKLLPKECYKKQTFRNR